jgi:hypothetical protein
MDPLYDEAYYRGLLEATQKGVANGKSFLEAVSSSEAASKNVAIQIMAETTKRRLEEFEQEADQLWDLFKRALRGD